MAALTMMSCGGRKHDAAYYMDMVDSIRKAEQVKEIQKNAGIYHDPIEAWFDTLGIHTLPIKSVGSEIWQLGHFSDVPISMNEHFDRPDSARLRAMALPDNHRHRVILIEEMVDSVTPRLHLFTMDKNYQWIDYLNIYAAKDVNEAGRHKHIYVDYYITSNYDILLLRHVQEFGSKEEPTLMDSRRFIITKEGKFEEAIIEL